MISEVAGANEAAGTLFRFVGAAQARDADKLFGWGTELTSRALTRLIESGKLKTAEHPKQGGEWLALAKLCKE